MGHENIPMHTPGDAMFIDVPYLHLFFRSSPSSNLAEVMILDNCIIVYKVLNDVIIYVVGTTQENELILQSVLQALDETISNLLKYEPTQIKEGRGKENDTQAVDHGGHIGKDSESENILK